MHNNIILTEAQEEFINGEISRRDEERENIYKDKFEDLKSGLHSALEDYAEKLTKEIMGDTGFADLAQYRKYKPVIDAMIKVMQMGGLQVEDDKTPAPSFNEFGFPVTDKKDDILFKDSTKNPAGIEISDEYKGAIEGNEALYNQVEDLKAQLEKINGDYKKMEAQNYIFESLAGMTKEIINEAVNSLSEYTKEQLSENDDKIIKDWLLTKNGDDKFKGLSVSNDGRGKANEEMSAGSLMSQINDAKDILTEGSTPFGQRAANKHKDAQGPNIKDFVVPGLPKKKIEVVPMASMKDNLDPQIEKAMADLQRTSNWRKKTS